MYAMFPLQALTDFDAISGDPMIVVEELLEMGILLRGTVVLIPSRWIPVSRRMSAGQRS